MNPIVGLLTFISEYLDAGLGMGYGTALAPILIIMGYLPVNVVPAILISQFFTDIASCIFHHNASNVSFTFDSRDFKVALSLGLISALGAVISVIIALKVAKWVLVLYIGLLVTSMGIVLLVSAGKTLPFSWKKVLGVSFLAAFNKGISGGGYGPLVTGGQMLAGINSKNAVGITAFAEAITCLVGFAVYWAMGKTIDWKLTGTLLIAAIPAVPFAVFTVKKIDASRLKVYVGILITILGLCTLFRVSSGG